MLDLTFLCEDSEVHYFNYNKNEDARRIMQNAEIKSRAMREIRPNQIRKTKHVDMLISRLYFTLLIQVMKYAVILTFLTTLSFVLFSFYARKFTFSPTRFIFMLYAVGVFITYKF